MMTLPIFAFILMVVLQVVEINDSVAMLRKKLEEAEEAKTVLLKARKSLRQDIRFPSLSVFDNLPFLEILRRTKWLLIPNDHIRGLLKKYHSDFSF